MSLNVDDALKKHLPKSFADAFIKAVPDRSVFLNGVNYQHEGKVWNVRLAMDGDNGLFIRLHADNAICGEYWEKRPDELYNENVNQQLNPKRTTRSGQGTYSLDIIDELKADDTTYQIIQKGEQQSDAQVPKVSFEVDGTVRKFFASCPALIPESDPKPITLPIAKKPTTIHEDNTSFPYGMIFKAIMSLAALYLLYKVVGFASSFWQESKASASGLTEIG